MRTNYPWGNGCINFGWIFLKLLSNLSLHFFLNRILCSFKKWFPVFTGMTGNGILRPYVPAPGDNRGHCAACLWRQQGQAGIHYPPLFYAPDSKKNKKISYSLFFISYIIIKVDDKEG
ncbi:hypothetical protein MBAV_001542 [Candidatus Magnetobacterium bavaricum]|uniref:Uncharacterized protein n=1 Tax=Candidatus Magnetobacterium bavaricum TaxID=29290 RepID=A0A0F3H017_9BACT|nr:hypothetical protein MBAV_001542 [Candidatus Magnetobacterium bavaricum]